jgi:hypothetical protein
MKERPIWVGTRQCMRRGLAGDSDRFATFTLNEAIDEFCVPRVDQVPRDKDAFRMGARGVGIVKRSYRARTVWVEPYHNAFDISAPLWPASRG